MIRTLIAATALSIAAMPALASTSDQFQMDVDINRSALETVEGAEQALAKLKQDIRERCVAESSDMKFGVEFATDYCERRTVKSAVRAIDNDNLTAAYTASLSK